MEDLVRVTEVVPVQDLVRLAEALPVVGDLFTFNYIYLFFCSFISKSVLVFENCGKCKRRMKFYRDALRCVDCNLTVHEECREDAPLPCIPSVTKVLLQSIIS